MVSMGSALRETSRLLKALAGRIDATKLRRAGAACLDCDDWTEIVGPVAGVRGAMEEEMVSIFPRTFIVRMP